MWIAYASVSAVLPAGAAENIAPWPPPPFLTILAGAEELVLVEVVGCCVAGPSVDAKTGLLADLGEERRAEKDSKTVHERGNDGGVPHPSEW